MKKFLFPIFFVLTVVFSLHSSFANTLTVSSLLNDGQGTLRERISLAQDGDTINMGLPGIIFLDSQLVITKDLFIRGLGPDTSLIDGQKKDRHFFVCDTCTLELSGFTLQNGDFSSLIEGSTRPGGGFPDGGSMKINGNFFGKNLVFSHNRGTYGGAVSISNEQQFITLVELENVSFIYNLAQASDDNPRGFDESGGALYQFGRIGAGTRLQAKNCTFSNNKAIFSAGAVYTAGELTGGTEADFTHCTFAFNEAERGAGFQNFRFSAVFFDRCLFGKNIGRVDQDVRGSVLSKGYTY